MERSRFATHQLPKLGQLVDVQPPRTYDNHWTVWVNGPFLLLGWFPTQSQAELVAITLRLSL